MSEVKMGKRGRPKMMNPLPVKLAKNDQDWLDFTVLRSGCPRSDVIRRAVRMLAAAVKANPTWNWVGETANELPPLSPEDAAELARSKEVKKPSKEGFSLPGLPGKLTMPSADSFTKINDRAKAQAASERKNRRKRS